VGVGLDFVVGWVAEIIHFERFFLCKLQKIAKMSLVLVR
jgi:hypothetical protein